MENSTPQSVLEMERTDDTVSCCNLSTSEMLRHDTVSGGILAPLADNLEALQSCPGQEKQRGLQGRIVGDDLNPRRCLRSSTFPSDLCSHRQNDTEAVVASDKLDCHNIVQVSENRDLHVHLLDCPEASPHLLSAINANSTIMLVKRYVAQIAALTNENVIFLVLEMRGKTPTRVLTISFKGLIG